MNSYFASTLMLALKKTKVTILFYHHKYHGGKALFSKKLIHVLTLIAIHCRNSYFIGTLMLVFKKTTKVIILLGFCFIVINIMEERLFSLEI